VNNELSQIVRQYRKNKPAVFAFFVAIILIFLAVFGPMMAPYDPIDTNLENRLLPGFWAGNTDNPLGTDNLGRDIYSRLLYGASISLKIGYSVIFITAIAGIFLGIVSGYFGGIVDNIVMRFVDILLAFPPLLLALVIAASLGTGIEKAMLAIAIVYIPSLARIVRGSVLTVKELPYIEASMAMGGNHFWITLRHVLPNIMTPVVRGRNFVCRCSRVFRGRNRSVHARMGCNVKLRKRFPASWQMVDNSISRNYDIFRSIII